MTGKAPVEADKFVLALRAAGQTMFEYDPASSTISWADEGAARTVLGLPDDAPITKALAYCKLVGPEMASERSEQIEAARRAGTGYRLEYQLLSSADDALGKRGHWVEESGFWMPFGDHERLVGMVRIIDAQKAREEELAHRATVDQLTGLMNKASFRQQVDEAIGRMRGTGGTGALLLVGIDGVPQINNDFGFGVADQVIIETGDRIASVLDEKACLGRVAGTKFAVLLPNADDDGRIGCVRRIMNVIRESLFETHAGGIGISVCVGCTTLNDKTNSVASATAETEAAFDDARRAGPSSFQHFCESTTTISQRQENSEKTDLILSALNENRVYLAYQPIVLDVAQEPTKYECLIRMHGDDGEEIPAPAFIPVAERLGLVHLLDRRVLELALDVLERVPTISLNVNLSWETIKDPVWAEAYLSQLRSHSDVCDRLTIELTETQAVDAIDASVAFVKSIKAFGCSFAMDDFGAGYTSFRNLKALDVDVLKIDGSYITDISVNKDNQLFVRAWIDLARNFSLKTVAEWVDNERDAMLLKALGIDYLQGFLVGRPEPRPEWGGEQDESPAPARRASDAAS